MVGPLHKFNIHMNNLLTTIIATNISALYSHLPAIMKLSAATLVLTALAGGALARNCKNNVYYCGSTLRNIGAYDAQIKDAMGSRGGDSQDALFYCVGGRDGDITYVTQCDACVDSGSSRSDYCA
ncbi:hypothetical protein E8E13_000634 [Curvularia kusanoi]|uniref:Uncharacterized protein n=1 Tax=Curvularia kusanoi TaxID=90978 RepID=A0A9P4T5S1_CURKU|nr:hypothetical protein E8E13_000634 [Curvularia kusanoi]